ncbi:MAG: site-specific DNA-methyltransferase [Chloroflexi bacterium]|nr:site-specific DNA-methyltransferase [Chloroflexota bacterium]
MKPYYQRDGITIYCGDCLKVMPQLEPPFAAIIADWPYGTTACSWDSIIPLEPLWRECKRLSDTAVLFGSQPFTSKLVMSNPEWFKYEWILRKNKSSNFLQANFQPIKIHENILVFSSMHATYTPASNAMIYNPEMSGIQDSFNKGQGTDTSLKSWKARRGNDYTLRSNHNDGRFPESIINFPSDKEKFHPTQKPEPLMAYLIRTYTNPGDLILDNTMGSGTTLVAAQNEGRRAVGIEISREYCRIAVERLRQPSFWSIAEPERGPEREQLELFEGEGAVTT